MNDDQLAAVVLVVYADGDHSDDGVVAHEAGAAEGVQRHEMQGAVAVQDDDAAGLGVLGSDDDVAAIQRGYIDRDRVEKCFVYEVQAVLKDITDQNAKTLYMLVKEGIIDIKIVIKESGMYHDKLALLEDYDGNTVACIGSNNETGSGLSYNYEKTRIYKSWFDLEGRIEDETKEFESIWKNNNPNLTVFDFMDAFERELIDRVDKKGFYKEETGSYKMRSYQIEAKEKWNNNGHTTIYFKRYC